MATYGILVHIGESLCILVALSGAKVQLLRSQPRHTFGSVTTLLKRVPVSEYEQD